MKASSFILYIVTALVTGCALEQEVSRTPRTAVEQVLLTQAVEKALVNLSVQLPEGVNVDMDVTGLESDRSRLDMTNTGQGTINRLGLRLGVEQRFDAIDAALIDEDVLAATGVGHEMLRRLLYR